MLLAESNSVWLNAVADLSYERVPRPVDPETQERLDGLSFDELMVLGDPRHSGTFATGVDLEALAEWE